jgi:hypothetical protein
LNAKYIFSGIFIGFFSLLILLKSNVFYQTGQEWFETCWKVKNIKDFKPENALEAVKWAKCEATAENAVYSAGLVTLGSAPAGLPDKIKAVFETCPSEWFGIASPDGLDGRALQHLERSGGPSLMDGLLPASFMISRVYRTLYPNCAEKREAAGFPKMTKKPNGSWEFESDCEPCKVVIQLVENENFFRDLEPVK